MVQGVQRLGFLPEQGKRRFIIGEIAAHHFDCDQLAVLDGMASVDFSHAAGAQVLVDLKNAIEPRPWGEADTGLGVRAISRYLHYAQPSASFVY